MFVYIIVCSESLKLYVGQHKGDDLQKYLSKKFYDAHRAYRGYSILYGAMRKHPRNTWSIHPLVSGIENRAELDELEKHFIRVLKTQHPDVGYNICRGGEGRRGPHTAETLRKIDEKRKAYWEKPEGHGRTRRQAAQLWTPEFREKMSTMMTGNSFAAGRVQSAAERAHHSESMKGKQNTLGHHLTEEHKRKLSLANIGKRITGHPQSAETRAKISRSLVGNTRASGHPSWNAGKRTSEETRQKISASREGKGLGNQNARRRHV